MDSLAVLAQALGVAYAAGINVPATVAVLGVAQRQGWIDHLPAGLDVVGNPWIIGIATGLYAAVTLLVLLILLVRRILRSLRRLLSGEWYRAGAAQTTRG